MNGMEEKTQALRKIYRSKNKRGMLIERQNNISWLLQGRTHVNLASINGIADLLLNDGGIYLVANNIEAVRLMREELLPEIQEIEYFWYDNFARNRIISELTDENFLTDSFCEKEIRELRLAMSPGQKDTYIELGRDIADVMQQACFEVALGMTEYKVASIMAKKCIERGIEPIVLLAAADERISLYRHPLPTSKTIEDYVMLVLGGRRYGQIACITRFIAFTEPSEIIKRKRDAVLYLDAFLLEETRPGNSTGIIFRQLIDNYCKVGYQDEWKLHHQGGLTGYNTRELKADFDNDILVKAGQVYAWNPSITGFKAEDTFIVDCDRNHILTTTDQLPSKAVSYNGETLLRPDILVRKAILRASNCLI